MSILKEYFIFTDGVYRSKKKWLGVSSGDDKRLEISMEFERDSMIIYWKENRGFETTIFEGKLLEEIDLEILLGWLEIDKYLKW